MEKIECNCKYISNLYLISFVVDDIMRIKVNVMNIFVILVIVNIKYY